MEEKLAIPGDRYLIAVFDGGREEGGEKEGKKGE